MRKGLVALVVLAAVLTTRVAWAETEFGTPAFVVAVDAKAKSITLKHTDKGVWTQTVATWDEKTEWSKAEKEVWDEKPATAAVAGELKKDSKVYVMISDRGSTQHWLVKLKTLPAAFEVK